MALATKQSYLLVDPTTEPLIPDFIPAPRLSDLNHKRIGLIDDSKDNAKALLEEIEALLRQRFGVAQVTYHRKPSASKPADPAVIAQMAATCDYVIVAIGS
jgi:hypothetical protein